MYKIFTLALLLSATMYSQNSNGIFTYNNSSLELFDSSTYLINATIPGIRWAGSIGIANTNQTSLDNLKSYPSLTEIYRNFTLSSTNDNVSETINKWILAKVFSKDSFLSSAITMSQSIGIDDQLTNLINNYTSSGIVATSINFSSYADRSEVFYKNKDEISRFEFVDHELLSKDGISLAIEKTVVSGSISSLYSAMPGNGAYTIQQAAYGQSWQGSDLSDWATLAAPNDSKAVSFTLYTTANVASTNTNGAFSINTGGDNSLSFRTIGSTGVIGWDNAKGTLNLSASLIETNAEIVQNGIFKSTTGIVVSNTGNLSELSIGENVQGYFVSNNYGKTGIVIENSNTNSTSSAGVIFKQRNIENWIGTYSANSNSDFFLSGSLILKSQGTGGILLSTSSDQSGSYGPIRFAFNYTEISRFTPNSLLIGTTNEVSSSVFTVESDSRGVLFPRLTSEKRVVMSNPEEGTFMYDKTLKKMCFYNGEKWEALCSEIID